MVDRSIISGNIIAILVRLAVRYFLVVNVSLMACFLCCSDLLMGPAQKMGKVRLLFFYLKPHLELLGTLCYKQLSCLGFFLTITLIRDVPNIISGLFKG